MFGHVKTVIRPLVPKEALSWYHRILAEVAAVAYGRPSRKLVVIGITGTKGKTTTSVLTARILEHAGHRVGLATTALIKVGEREELNPFKMTMLGRFKLQKLLAEMVAAGCTHAVIETSSEGILQHRHRGIAYDVALVTNLTPEHIESHGSFEKYRAAKQELFRAVADRRPKTINGKVVPRVAAVNGCFADAPGFMNFAVDKLVTYHVEKGCAGCAVPPAAMADKTERLMATEVVTGADGVSFLLGETRIALAMPGMVSVWNALAATAAALAVGVPVAKSAAALAAVTGVPGRFERIAVGQPFSALVDYAHEPESFRRLFAALNDLPHKRIIHVFGATGGGRDAARRPVMGEISSAYADIVIVTTDDPYDEDPAALNRQVIAGVRGKKAGETLFDIVDRRAAIARAVELARPDDLVLVTGKGAEQAMALAGGRKIPWDDRAVLREEITKRYGTIHPPSR